MANIVQFTLAPGAAPTMSTREIADLTGKRHHHVVRDARRMLAALGEGETKFGFTYLDAQGKAQVELAHVEYLQAQEDGGEKARLQVRVTSKGAAELAKRAAPKMPDVWGLA